MAHVTAYYGILYVLRLGAGIQVIGVTTPPIVADVTGQEFGRNGSSGQGQREPSKNPEAASRHPQLRAPGTLPSPTAFGINDATRLDALEQG